MKFNEAFRSWNKNQAYGFFLDIVYIKYLYIFWNTSFLPLLNFHDWSIKLFREDASNIKAIKFPLSNNERPIESVWMLKTK